MYTKANAFQKKNPATRKLVTRRVLNYVDGLIQDEMLDNLGDWTYTDLFAAAMPNYVMGTNQAKCIGEALQIIEEIHDIDIRKVFPRMFENRRKGEWQTIHAS